MNKTVKYTIAFLSVLIIRLIPFRAPNLEPMMALIMPISKKYGILMSFFFGFLSIVIYDSMTSGWGIWTLITGFSYGLVGIGATLYFKKRSGRRNYVIYAIVATILYDAITGLTIGPLFFNQTFAISLAGQIPFTIIHLLSNVSFAIVLSPVIEKWLVEKEEKVVVKKVVLVS